MLVSYVFAREIWHSVLHRLGFGAVAPQQDARSLSGWWCAIIKKVPKELKKDLNYLIILVVWELWKHQSL
uniref:Uncharacterized protein n=1 Tax=Arundo donax TaxID=35708 RepID=A0A0A9HIV7_ARUDO